MLSLVSTLTFFATVFMAWRSFQQWGAYHRGAVSRTGLVNQLFVTALLAALALVSWLFRGLF